MDAFFWVAVAAVLTVSSARITRVLTYDDFPPVQFFRDRFIDFMDRGPRRRQWSAIAFCPWCLSFWVTGVLLLAGYFSDWHVAWFLINGSFASSYLAAMLIVRDGDTTKDDEPLVDEPLVEDGDDN